MCVSEEFRNKCLYHFTHINNLEAIIRNQCLQAKNSIEGDSKSIAYSDIQDRRSRMDVPVGPRGVVHDYVPFYFCPRSPMLHAVISHKIAEQRDIVYLEFPITLLESDQAVFTSSSANSNIPPLFYTDVADLNQLDWGSIGTWRWSARYDVEGELPVRKKKMAEALIKGSVSLDSLMQVVAWSTNEFIQVRDLFLKYHLTPPRIFSNYAFNARHYYYNDAHESIFLGPDSLYKHYTTCIFSLECPDRTVECDFQNFSELKEALDQDFSCVECTEGCVGLQSANDMHLSSVDEHSLEVVRILRGLEEFQLLDDEYQVVMELAGYFHDVGKGPRTRWQDGVQRVDHDHPAKSLDLVVELLCNEIKQWDRYEAQLLCMLVCYHDLVGMIIGSGRQLDELVRIVDDENELDMLIMLAKADIISVREDWWSDDAVQQIKNDVINDRGW